jgi:hypothetical protein
MAYTTTMKKGYQFVGSTMYPWGHKQTKTWAHWINQYCKEYTYAGQPLDANAIAGLISRENGPWDPNVKAQDYASTGSVGLGQFNNNTGPKYGINTYQDKINPEKNIKAICNLFSRCLATAKGNYRLGYNVYNAGHIVIGPSKATIANMDGFETCYKWWAKHGDGKMATAPVKTTNNQNAVNKANAQKQANAKAQKAKEDKLRQQDIREEKAEKDAIAKAKLTRNANAIRIAQAKAKANAVARANANKIIQQNKIRQANADKLKEKTAYKTNNPIKNTPSSPADATTKTLPKTSTNSNRILRSGFSLIGMLLILIVMNNVEIPETTIE